MVESYVNFKEMGLRHEHESWLVKEKKVLKEHEEKCAKQAKVMAAQVYVKLVSFLHSLVPE